MWGRRLPPDSSSITHSKHVPSGRTAGLGLKSALPTGNNAKSPETSVWYRKRAGEKAMAPREARRRAFENQWKTRDKRLVFPPNFLPTGNSGAHRQIFMASIGPGGVPEVQWPPSCQPILSRTVLGEFAHQKKGREIHARNSRPKKWDVEMAVRRR
jgi:hypothetical protein